MAEHMEPNMAEQAEAFRETYHAIRQQMTSVIVGHEEVIDGVLICVFASGHALLEGLPGLGKTLLIRSLAQAVNLDFSRIQFTPDLMPADITGTTIVVESDAGHRQFEFQPGPIFGQMVLADEINRATPKTQSALLEAMQERSVTIGDTTHKMDEPFFVMATQNPIEHEGTYPLPEAQLDRFFFKLLVGYSNRDEIHEILNRTTRVEPLDAEPVVDSSRVREFQKVVRSVLIAPHVQDYAIRCVLSTHPDSDFATRLTRQFVRYGASPRAAQAMVLAGKVKALLDHRAHVSIDDLRMLAMPAMRHRVILNFEGQAEGISEDMLIQDVIDTLPVEQPA